MLHSDDISSPCSCFGGLEVRDENSCGVSELLVIGIRWRCGEAWQLWRRFVLLDFKHLEFVVRVDSLLPRSLICR